jgi:hypothetical protein
MENPTADESDDELLLTFTSSKAHHKHSVCVPQTPDSDDELESDDADDELDLLPRNKTRHSSACTRYRHAQRTQDMDTMNSDPNADGEGAQDTCTDTESILRPSKTRVTVCPSGFLDLPREVILLCLWDLPFEDIERCRTLNRKIYSLISGCPRMRYRAKQHRAGVEENHYTLRGQPSWPIPERISKLRDLEKRWLEFRPTAIYNELKVHNTAMPKVTSDYLLAPHVIGDKLTGVKYIQTSSGGCGLERELRFTLIEFAKPSVAFGAAIEEHDLIAAVQLYVFIFFPVILLIYMLEHS